MDGVIPAETEGAGNRLPVTDASGPTLRGARWRLVRDAVREEPAGGDHARGRAELTIGDSVAPRAASAEAIRPQSNRAPPAP